MANKKAFNIGYMLHKATLEDSLGMYPYCNIPNFSLMTLCLYKKVTRNDISVRPPFPGKIKFRAHAKVHVTKARNCSLQL